MQPPETDYDELRKVGEALQAKDASRKAAERALEYAIRSTNIGTLPTEVIQRARLYFGFLQNPEGITEVSEELIEQVKQMLMQQSEAGREGSA